MAAPWPQLLYCTHCLVVHSFWLSCENLYKANIHNMDTTGVIFSDSTSILGRHLGSLFIQCIVEPQMFIFKCLYRHSCTGDSNQIQPNTSPKYSLLENKHMCLVKGGYVQLTPVFHPPNRYVNWCHPYLFARNCGKWHHRWFVNTPKCQIFFSLKNCFCRHTSHLIRSTDSQLIRTFLIGNNLKGNVPVINDLISGTFRMSTKPRDF